MSTPSFKKFSKPKTAKKFTDFAGRVWRSPWPPEQPSQAVFKPAIESRAEHLGQVLKDDELGKRVAKLEEKHHYATVPEMLAMDWLDKNLADYVFQAKVNGGFRPGGLVPDFVLRRMDKGIALLIHGEYWHNVPGKREKDAVDKLRLVGQYTNGVYIDKAVIVWESRLMRSKQQRDEAMTAALQGIELGP